MIRVPVRVLVVHDCAATRHLVRDVLTGDLRIDVIGTAASASAALNKLAELRPDAIVLDVEMSIKDAAAHLNDLRDLQPDLLIVVLCAPTEQGAAMALDALAAGASEFVIQPAGLAARLIPRLVGLNEARRLAAHPGLPRGPLPVPFPTSAVFHEATSLVVHPLPAEPPPFLVAKPFPLPARRALLPNQRIARPVRGERVVRGPGEGPADADFGVLVIGAGTGGPQALAALLAVLPADLPVPVLVVQHLPQPFVATFARRLDGLCRLSVAVAGEGVPVEPGRVLIAPGGRHLEVLARGASIVVRLSDAPAEASHRPSVDILFRSAATVFRHRTLGVVLTGMGRDGVQGATAIRNLAGTVYVQAEMGCASWEMPGAVVGAGQADRVAALPELSHRIVAALGRNRNSVLAGPGAGGGVGVLAGAVGSGSDLGASPRSYPRSPGRTDESA